MFFFSILQNAMYQTRPLKTRPLKTFSMNILHSSCRLKLVEGKDCFILEACFSNTVFSTMAQPFSKPNEVMIDSD